MHHDIENYLKEHQLNDSAIKTWGIRILPNCIVIPIKDLEGKHSFSKYRHFGGRIKYSYEKGASMQLFGGFLITDETTDVFITEGELKAIAINENFGSKPGQKTPHEVVAVSSTGGARSFKDEWFELFKGKKVHILFDNDAAGKEGAMLIWARLQKIQGIASVDVLGLNEGYKDINECIDAEGGLKWKLMVPSWLHMKGIATPKKRERIAEIRKFFSMVDEYELEAYGEEYRWYVSKMREIARSEYLLNKREKNEKLVSYGDSIEQIKKIPIDSLVKFRNGVAPCIFHDDRHPSMHYNDAHSQFPNTVKCYSCGKFADVIDVVMALNNVNFAEALQMLRGK